MKKIFFIATFIITGLLGASLKTDVFSEEEAIRLYLGEVEIIPVSHPSRIVIGNPNIIDVTNVTKNEITLNPKAVGTTTLVFWDNFGEQSFQVKVFAENMQEIKSRIDSLLENLNLPEVSTQAQDEEAKVMLLGSVKTTEEKDRVIAALGALKEKTTNLILVKEQEAVVEIDVQVIELNKDATSTLGFTWPGSISLTDSSVPTSTAVTGLKNIFYVSKFTRSAFNVSLDVLIQEGKARVLSRPRLACQSGKEAELMVGGEKPIFTTTVAATTGASGTAVEYKEFGIKLKIKPTVTEQERIKLGLNVEVSEVGATAEFIGATTNRTAQAFPLTKRNAATELYLNNGQTMAIGGLIKQKTEEDIRRTPWLSEIPILGAAFRKKTTKIGGGTGERGNTELFIMLTPTIVSAKTETVPAEKITLKKPQDVSYPMKEQPSNQALHNYAKIIQKRILDNLSYPILAKEAGFSGRVKLSLHLASSGELLDVALKTSSGYKILDDNALSVAREISHYPPIPPALDKEELWIDIPIDYRLD